MSALGIILAVLALLWASESHRDTGVTSDICALMAWVCMVGAVACGIVGAR